MSKYVESASVKQADLIIACCSCQDNVPKPLDSSHHVLKNIFWGLSTVLGLSLPGIAKFSTLLWGISVVRPGLWYSFREACWGQSMCIHFCTGSAGLGGSARAFCTHTAAEVQVCTGVSQLWPPGRPGPGLACPCMGARWLPSAACAERCMLQDLKGSAVLLPPRWLPLC